MSGHSKWSQIKHQKGVADHKRGQVFTKLTREIIAATRQGGGEPAGNSRLRLAVEKAREANMPMDNIQRAIKRALGQGEGQSALEELLYEGIGPGGVALLVSVLTDSRNRAVSEIRNILERGAGKLAAAGAVAWAFEAKGVILIEEKNSDRAQEIALQAIDLGAEDFTLEDGLLELRTSPERFEALRAALEERQIKVSSAELAMVPKSSVTLDARTAEQTLRLLDRLEELDDVQKVYSNAEFPDEVLEQYRTAV
ncbi:MAG: YebC/PmpR family DNA-binding transcriptional regulator [Chloroflexi bacterium]|nr:YebC/PmpR family DNA-binding transcriptional regulator [Chloroflexota bacterium]